MRPATSRDHAWKSRVLTEELRGREAPSFVIGRRQVAKAFAFQDRNARLRIGEPGLAELDEVRAALVGGKGFLERKLAIFHACDDRLQFLERLFECGRILGRRGGFSGHETDAKKRDLITVAGVRRARGKGLEKQGKPPQNRGGSDTGRDGAAELKAS